MTHKLGDRVRVPRNRKDYKVTRVIQDFSTLNTKRIALVAYTDRDGKNQLTWENLTSLTVLGPDEPTVLVEPKVNKYENLQRENRYLRGQLAVKIVECGALAVTLANRDKQLADLKAQRNQMALVLATSNRKEASRLSESIQGDWVKCPDETAQRLASHVQCLCQTLLDLGNELNKSPWGPQTSTPLQDKVS